MYEELKLHVLMSPMVLLARLTLGHVCSCPVDQISHTAKPRVNEADGGVPQGVGARRKNIADIFQTIDHTIHKDKMSFHSVACPAPKAGGLHEYCSKTTELVGDQGKTYA